MLQKNAALLILIVGWTLISYIGLFVIGMSYPMNNPPALLTVAVYTLFAPAGLSYVTLQLVEMFTGVFFGMNIFIIFFWSAVLLLSAKYLTRRK